MTNNEKQQIIALWEQGVSLEQIYQMLPYKRYVALKMVNELRVQGILKPRKRTVNAIKAIALAWQNETKDIQELSEMFGYSPYTISTYLQLSGVREGKRPIFNHKHSAKTTSIIKDIEQGKSTKEIVEKYGVTRQYVHQVKNRFTKTDNLEEE